MRYKYAFVAFLFIGMSLATAFGLRLYANSSSPTSPPEGIDFSSLSVENPVHRFELTGKGVYKAALQGSWKSLSSNPKMKWVTTYSDSWFQISPNVLDHPAFDAFLVSPAIDLAAVSSHELSFMVSSKSLAEVPLKVLIINQKGGTLHEIYSEVASYGSSFAPQKITLPASMSGVGFIAFRVSSDGTLFREYKLKDFKLLAVTSGPDIAADPVALSWNVTKVGEKSEPKKAKFVISSFDGSPVATLEGDHAADFEISNPDVLTKVGGELSMRFAPKTPGEKKATLVVSAGAAKVSVALMATAEGQAGPEESTELLIDQFFHNFDEQDRPKDWIAEGAVEKMKVGYHQNTGFGLRLKGTVEKKASIAQKVDLNRVDKLVVEGDMLEGMIHYRGQVPKNPDGALRLACYWENAAGEAITSSEDLFINNKDRYFDKQKAWGSIRFRTIAPKGAAKFVFRVETNTSAIVDVDDFSLLKLVKADREREFISIIPEYAIHSGQTNTPIEGRILVQSVGLQSQQVPTIGGPTGELELEQNSLPVGNKVQDLKYTITAKKKGVYAIGKKVGAYSIAFKGVEPTPTLNMVVNVIEAGNAPQVKLQGGAVAIRKFEAFPREKDEEEIVFDIAGVIDHVNISVQQTPGGPFRIGNTQLYYSETSGDLLVNKVKVTFAPNKEGAYSARLALASTSMDTVYFDLSGLGKSVGEGWIETFAADKKLPSNFTSEVWNGYHLFDRGYYKLDGHWNAAGSVTVDKKGAIECDELFAYGIDQIKLFPEEAAKKCRVEVSVDGGGHWAEVVRGTGDVYMVNNHRASRFRVVNTIEEALSLSRIELALNAQVDVQTFAKIEEAMLPAADDKPLALLRETFDSQRHTRGINLPSWQNLIIKGDRPFRGWDQKNQTTGAVEEHCAQITFYNSLTTEDTGEREAWLISPTLSYKQAKSKVLTFRLRYQLPTENGQEKFGVYIITEQGRQLEAQYLDITKYLLVKEVEKDLWYDYFIELDKIEGIKIEDLFHVAFSYYSPVSGRKTTLNFMLDDLTFGRTDYTIPTVDKDLLTFQFIPDVKTEPQTITVGASNPDKPMSALLLPGHLKGQFILDKNVLPANGGVLSVAFKSKEKKDRAAAILIQARGGASKLVKLMAVNLNSVELIEDSREVKIYPTEANEYIRIEGDFDRYYVFSLSGSLLMQGGYKEQVDVTSLPAGRYIVRLITSDGTVWIGSFHRK
ncbi:MAG: choice-of-anchor J domain-containing protein [Porphyromonas sp.]|nr:choice-of-anchor J domain-containing protein [Porphyromonas sp.]